MHGAGGGDFRLWAGPSRGLTLSNVVVIAIVLIVLDRRNQRAGRPSTLAAP